MKLLKQLLFILLLTPFILIIALEGYYHYKVWEYKPENLEASIVFNEIAHDILWTSEENDNVTNIEELSATKLIYKIFKFILDDKPIIRRPNLSSGSNLLTQAIRIRLFKKETHTKNHHLHSAVSTIWLSKRTDINTLSNFILENTFYGQNTYGLHNASKLYFNKNHQELSYSELISIISLIKGPSLYNPSFNPERFEKHVKWLDSEVKTNWPKKYKDEIYTMPEFLSISENHLKIIRKE